MASLSPYVEKNYFLCKTVIDKNVTCTVLYEDFKKLADLVWSTCTAGPNDLNCLTCALINNTDGNKMAFLYRCGM